MGKSVANVSSAQEAVQAACRALQLHHNSKSRGQRLIDSVVADEDETSIILKVHALGCKADQFEISCPLATLPMYAGSPEALASHLLGLIVKEAFGAELETSPFRPRALKSILEREGAIKDSVPSPYASEINKHAGASRDVVVLGRSASGKTVAGLQAALAMLRNGTTVEWLDLSEPDRSVWDVLPILSRSRLDKPIVLFIDDAQANPLEASRISHLQSIVSHTDALRFSVVVLAWASARQSVEALWPEGIHINVNPDRVLREITGTSLSNFSAYDRQQLEHFVNGDLVAVTVAVAFMRREKRFPTGDELASEALRELIGEQLLDDKSAEILYRTAALSQFEIDVSAAHLEQLSAEVVQTLVSRRALRRSGAYLSIGHRSSARLLLRALATRFPTLATRLPDPGKLAVGYLRTTDTTQLVTTLERLDIARLQASHFDQHGTKFLVRLWGTFQLLLRALDKAGSNDPTWSDDTGSSAIASRILGEFGFASAARAVEHQRDRWRFAESDSVPIPVPPPPNERKDFEEIKRCMIEEEAGSGLPAYAELAEAIDFDRMHRTWVLGFLLGTEAGASDHSTVRLATLKSIAKKAQLHGGGYYPLRVPWVTARVLIGLAQTGETIDSSETIRNACNWLLSEAPAGPCSFGAWHPHTGVWNTVVGTTAMCLNALVRCGVRTDNSTVDLAINYLLDGRSQWSRVGKEIDCAFALEAFLLTGAPWRDFSSELIRLIDWAHDPTIWQTVVLDAAQAKDESLKIPLIASSLAGIIWSIVKAELPLLLEDLATGALLPDSLSYSAYREEVQNLLRRLEEVKSHIRTNIEQRLTLLTSAPAMNEQVRLKLSEFREWAKRCDDLIEHATRMSSQSSRQSYSATLASLRRNANALGLEVLRGAWEPIEIT
jgi:hypothetical protein